MMEGPVHAVDWDTRVAVDGDVDHPFSWPRLLPCAGEQQPQRLLPVFRMSYLCGGPIICERWSLPGLCRGLFQKLTKSFCRILKEVGGCETELRF